jgi:sugar/nucleoside kinase (ribokinase family)
VPRADVVVVGESFEDLVFFGLPRLPKLGEEIKTQAFYQTVGGGAVITAVGAARLGLRTSVLSALSPGAARVLKAEGIRVRNLRRPAEQGALSVALSTKRNRSFVTFNGVNDALEPRLAAAAPRVAARHVHFAFFPAACRQWLRVVEGLRARGITTSWDFGWNERLRRDARFTALLGALDYVFVNEQEAALYARTKTAAAAVPYWRAHARNAVIKLGSRGCRWIAPGRDLFSPPIRVRAVETTGAGDAFNAGFIFGLRRGLGPAATLRAANFVGAMSTRAAGGIAALPRRRELA